MTKLNAGLALDDIEDNGQKSQPPLVSGLILAGGRGSRVDGQDKGLISFQGQPLIERQLNWLNSQVSEILISANRNLDQYTHYGHPVIRDQRTSFPGPLEGIFQGLADCTSEWLFVVPVDVPFLPENLIPHLFAEIKPGERAIYLKSQEREHYLLLLIHKSLSEALKRYNDSGQKRVRDFLHSVGARGVDLGIPETRFANLNQLDDFL